MSDGAEKICVICGASCAGQARIKNQKGQYAHKACAERQQAGAAARGGGVNGAGPGLDPLDDDDGLGALLDDLPGLAAGTGDAGLRPGCPGCGAALAEGTVICMSCGFDTRSGKARKTKVVKAGPSTGLGGLASEAGGLAKSGTTFLVGSLLGGAAAGLVGALVWAGIAIGTGYEVGYIAIGVGLLCGVGTALGSRGQTGVMTGCIAVLFAVISICAGKYFTVAHFTDKYLGSEAGAFIDEFTPEERDQYFLQQMIDTEVAELLEDETLDEETAAAYEEMLYEGEFPHDYPDDLVAEVRASWEGMSEGQRADMIESTKADIVASAALVRGFVQEQGFIASFGLLDILFFLIAVAAAYKLGSGGED